MACKFQSKTAVRSKLPSHKGAPSLHFLNFVPFWFGSPTHYAKNTVLHGKNWRIQDWERVLYAMICNKYSHEESFSWALRARYANLTRLNCFSSFSWLLWKMICGCSRGSNNGSQWWVRGSSFRSGMSALLVHSHCGRDNLVKTLQNLKLGFLIATIAGRRIVANTAVCRWQGW